MKTEPKRKYKHTCDACGHSWLGQKEVVISCVSCKSYFNRRRVIKDNGSQPKSPAASRSSK